MAFLIGACFPGLSGVAGVAGTATRIIKVPFAVPLAGFPLVRATRRGHRARHLLHRMAGSLALLFLPFRPKWLHCRRQQTK
jgi:hypothetical protein